MKKLILALSLALATVAHAKQPTLIDELSRLFQTRTATPPSYLPASASHFFMYEVFAAPANGLPFLSTALDSQEVAAVGELPPSHFFMKEVFAAPVSGLPFLPTACASQLEAPAPAALAAPAFPLGAEAGACANTVPADSKAMAAMKAIFLIRISLIEEGTCLTRSTC
jgi:hypothetical protein